MIRQAKEHIIGFGPAVASLVEGLLSEAEAGTIEHLAADTEHRIFAIGDCLTAGGNTAAGLWDESGSHGTSCRAVIEAMFKTPVAA